MKKNLSHPPHSEQTYAPPTITHKGNLTQFAGSPLGVPQSNPLELPQK